MFKFDTEKSEEGNPPGRKFIFGRYAILLATLGFVVTALSPVLATNYSVFVGALGALFTIYCGGNIGQKFAEKPAPEVKVISDRRKDKPGAAGN